MNDTRGRRSKRDEDEGTIEPPESDLGPEHCPNCGGVDFFELAERGEWYEVCADCGRRVLGLA